MNIISTFENGPRKSIIKAEGGAYTTNGFYVVEYYLDNKLIGTSRHTNSSLAEEVADEYVLTPNGQKAFLTE
jgi:hypothetical protein